MVLSTLSKVDAFLFLPQVFVLQCGVFFKIVVRILSRVTSIVSFVIILLFFPDGIRPYKILSLTRADIGGCELEATAGSRAERAHEEG